MWHSELFSSLTTEQPNVCTRNSPTRPRDAASEFPRMRTAQRTKTCVQLLSDWKTRPKRSQLHAARRLLVCGAHGAPPDPGASSRPLARPADGSAQESQRHPGETGPAEEGPQVGIGVDRADPARSAAVRLDCKGLRHADGGAQVRPCEGGTSPQPVPDQ